MLLLIKAILLVALLVAGYYLVINLARKNKHEGRKRDIEHQIIDVEREAEIEELKQTLEQENNDE